jgi:hypothetical protein
MRSAECVLNRRRTRILGTFGQFPTVRAKDFRLIFPGAGLGTRHCRVAISKR